MDERDMPAGSPILMENRGWEWALALFLHGLFFVFMLEYHRWRGRDYFESLRSFLFVANKAMGIASVFSIGFSLAAGSLNRLLRLPAAAVRLRRPLGVVGAFGILPHVVVSLLFLGWKFDLKYFVGRWPVTALGIAALAGFLWLAALSWPWALQRLGTAKWKAWQQTGYVLILAVFLHAVVLTGKLANWTDWFRKIGRPDNAPVPPGSVVIALCILLVLGLKAADGVAGALRRRP